MTITHTRTHTHTVERYADPFLICTQCGQRAEGFPVWPPESDPDTHRPTNLPCGHHADIRSVCPSWSPVDGCQCAAHLGAVPHGPAPDPVMA